MDKIGKIIIFCILIVVLFLVIVVSFNKNKVFTVTFDSNGGNSVASQKIGQDGYVSQPLDPFREGYEFIGWFYNGDVFDFSSKVMNDMVLVAGWKKVDEVCVVTLDIDGIKKEIDVLCGNSIKQSDLFFLKKDGFIIEWYYNDKKIEIEKFAITNSLLLKGKYFENKEEANEDDLNEDLVEEKQDLVQKIQPVKPSTSTNNENSYHEHHFNDKQSDSESSIITNLDRVHFIKFNSPGNAILLESNGKYGMIDAGGKSSIGIKSCQDNIFSYLKELNVKELEFVVVSHFHWDHVYCLAGFNESSYDGFLLNNPDINVKKIIIKEYDLQGVIQSSRIKNFYSRIVSSIDREKIDYFRQDGQRITLGNMTLSLFNSQQRFNQFNVEDNENANSAVVVLEVKSGNQRFLSYFPGDVQNTANAGNVENEIAKTVANQYNAVFDLYVASHHGYSSNNPNNAIGIGDDKIQFKNSVITNSISQYCGAVKGQSSAGNAISRIYQNMARNTYNSNGTIYFSGSDTVVVNYSSNGISINGGEVLKCTESTCNSGSNVFNTILQQLNNENQTCGN